MNVLRNPEHASRGAAFTGREFEELAIEAGLMEDLLDRTDLGTGEFLTRAVARANILRMAENRLHWAIDLDGCSRVMLVEAHHAKILSHVRAIMARAQSTINESQSLSALVFEVNSRS